MRKKFAVKMKKCIGALMLALSFILAGCGKEEIPVEDFVQTNPAAVSINNIMKSDTGYYYGTAYGKTMSLHYYDMESGQNIFLCSKPECRHDGDTFCTATSSKYEVNSTYFYGGSLYLDVIETVGTESFYKLLRVAADGSELTEVVTYMTMNNTTTMSMAGQPMMIHRGVAVLPYRLCSIGDSNVGVTGTYFYNLITGELTGLPELTYGKNSNGRERFSGYGDYIYFNTQMDRKNTLSRYCLTDGTVEDMELLRTYVGVYEVMDEDTIYYYWSEDKLFEYKISTKENIQHDGVFAKSEVRYYDANGEEIEDCDVEKTDEPIYGIETIHRYECSDMMTDGTYLYVGENLAFRNVNTDIRQTWTAGGQVEETEIPCYVHVLDRELNEVAKVKICTKDLLGYYDYFSFKILDDVVYLQTLTTVFKCPIEDFIAGEPVFTPVYDHEIEISPAQYWLVW